jgi:predicted DNA-binding transcriptional regulator AlpA
MTALLDTAQIAALLHVTRRTVTEKIVTRPDFPAPEVHASQKMRLWKESQVLAWARKRHGSRAAMSEAVSL